MGSQRTPQAVPGRCGRRALLLGAVVVVGVLAGAGAAAADDGPASPLTPEHAAWWESEKDLWERQDRLSGLAEWIRAQPGIESSGYIESVNDPEAGSTILLWRGPANSMQQRIRDKGRQMGIPVGVQPREHGWKEIERAQQALLGLAGKGAFANFRMEAVGGLSADFDGTFLTGDYIRPPAGSRADADAALARAATAAAGIPVKVESGVTITPLGGMPADPQPSVRTAVPAFRWGQLALASLALASLALSRRLPAVRRATRRRHPATT